MSDIKKDDRENDSFWDIPYTPPRINTNPTAGRHNTDAADVTVKSDAPDDTQRLKIPPRDKYAAGTAPLQQSPQDRQKHFRAQSQPIYAQGQPTQRQRATADNGSTDILFDEHQMKDFRSDAEDTGIGTHMNNASDIDNQHINPNGASVGANPQTNPNGAENSAPRPLFRSAQVAPVRNAFFDNQKRRPANQPNAADSHKPTLLCEYSPDDSMIRKVSVYRWFSNYNFYENFCRDADRLFAVHGTACPKVNFFSYIPQYNQMDRAQLAFYLYFRERVRCNEYPDVDLSYILLYIYEIINLPERINPADGMRMLCEVWSAYRKAYPRIDKYLAEWVCDYGLINSLPPPDSSVLPFLDRVLEYATLREYYLRIPAAAKSEAPADTSVMAAMVAEYASGYRYRDSKYAAGDNLPLFVKHITGAVGYVMETTAKHGEPLLNESHLRTVKISRDAFSGSLCAYNVKRRIDVEYLSFSRSHEFRDVATDLVKYAENRIRASLKIKSRLGSGNLPEKYRSLADAYFDVNLPMERKRASKTEQTPEYERLYDAPVSTLTVLHAAEIEEASWSNTKKLTADLSAEAEFLVAVPEVQTAKSAIDAPETETAESIIDAPETETDVESGAQTVFTPQSGENYTDVYNGYNGTAKENTAQNGTGGEVNIYDALLDSLDETSRADIAAALDGSFELRCRESRRFADAAAEKINEAAVSATGDIILENADGVWSVVGDYRKELTQCLYRLTT